MLLDDTDEKLFQNYFHLLEVKDYDDGTIGYTILFYFQTNPYFENAIISKSFEVSTTGEPSSKCTVINWKEGMDLTKKNNNMDDDEEEDEKESFFSWFNDNGENGSDELGEVIKEDIWPKPLRFYLVGENDPEEDEDDSEDDNEDGGETILDMNLEEIEETEDGGETILDMDQEEIEDGGETILDMDQEEIEETEDGGETILDMDQDEEEEESLWR